MKLQLDKFEEYYDKFRMVSYDYKDEDGSDD